MQMKLNVFTSVSAGWPQHSALCLSVEGCTPSHFCVRAARAPALPSSPCTAAGCTGEQSRCMCEEKGEAGRKDGHMFSVGRLAILLFSFFQWLSTDGASRPCPSAATSTLCLTLHVPVLCGMFSTRDLFNWTLVR